MKEKFILTDGYVEVDNTQFHIQVNGFKKDLKNRGGWLTVLLVIISTNVFNNFRNEKHFQKASNYFDFGLRILGMITIHFFIPRLISEIRNPVVGLIKRNQNVSHKLIQNNNPNVNRKAITMESLLTVTKCLPF